MAKFKAEEKLKIVLRYLKGNESIRIRNIAKEVSVSPTIVSGWIR